MGQAAGQGDGGRAGFAGGIARAPLRGALALLAPPALQGGNESHFFLAERKKRDFSLDGSRAATDYADALANDLSSGGGGDFPIRGGGNSAVCKTFERWWGRFSDLGRGEIMPCAKNLGKRFSRGRDDVTLCFLSRANSRSKDSRAIIEWPWRKIP